MKQLSDRNVLIENLYDEGKIKVEHVQSVIENKLIFPLLRGRDVAKWNPLPSAQIILAQDPDLGKGIPEAKMKRDTPKTYSYFKKFEGKKAKPERGSLRARVFIQEIL